MAAYGDLLRQLLKGYVKRDDSMFKAAAEELIREERTKNHRLLAEDLERILLNGNGQFTDRHISASPYDVPKDRERGFPLLDIGEYRLDWDRLILPMRTLDRLVQITREHQRHDVLAAGGLSPTQRVLFFGPPGCGKTLTAQVMASALSLPLVTVRFDAVVSSYLGETASNLRRVFDFIQRGRWVVLFDEFDAIGKDRDNPFEHGELKRVVNSLLQLMDAFKGESLLIAATNHENLLDSAIWRRFQAIIRFSLPTEQERVLLLQKFMGSFDTSEVNFEQVARNTKGATGSDLEQMALQTARTALLDARTRVRTQDLQHCFLAIGQRLPTSRRKLKNSAKAPRPRHKARSGNQRRQTDDDKRSRPS